MKIFLKSLRYSKRRKQKIFPGKVFTPPKSIFAKISTLRVFIGFALVLSSLSGLVFILKRSEFLSIQEISLAFGDDKSRVNRQMLEEDLKKLLGQKNILFINSAEIEKKIKSAHLVVNSLEIKRDLPSRVEVSILERRPLAKISGAAEQEGEQTIFLIDETGLIFAPAREEKLPLIKTQESLTISQRLSSTKIVSVLEVLLAFDPEIVSDVEIGEEKILRLKIEEIPTVFSLQKSVSEQIDILKLVLKSYKIKNVRLKKIDLRYERPVVSY